MFILKPFLRLWSSCLIAFKRLLALRGLALAILLGLVVVIALVMSIPLYAEATYYRMLSEGLFSDTPRYRGQTIRPPVALLFRYSGSFTGPVQWEHVGPLDSYFADQVYRDLKLPPAPDVPGARMFNTGTLGLFSAQDADKVTEIQPRYRIELACVGQPEQHIRILEGSFPADATNPEGAFEIAIHKTIAEKMGVQIGETYIAYDLRAMQGYEDAPAKFEMRVAGIWEPADPREDFWVYQVALENTLFVSESTFANRISPALEDEIYQAVWYLPLDAEKLYMSDIAPLLTRIELLRRDVTKLLAGTNLDTDPVKVLQSYQEAANGLTALLFAFSVPILSLIVVFIVLVITLTVEHHRNQIAILRSRGATASQVSSITALESVVLGAIALIVALPLSLLLAYAIGQARSFLDFSLATDLRVGMTWATARFGVAAAICAVIAQVIPTLEAARHTIVTYKQERARVLRPPWWQRAWLDVLLLIPAGYGAYLLRQQGGLAPSTEIAASDPLQNPLLFLAPALSLFALALVILRVLPWLMKALAWLSAQTRSVGFLLAARQLARAPGVYAAPLGLLILTLSMATYTASLSATLETHLHDQQFYWVGADASLLDTGDEAGSSGDNLMLLPLDDDEARWAFLPVTEYRTLPGVAASARLGRYKALVQTGDRFKAGTFLGVDRLDFPQVAFWRADFAPASLGELMNALAITENGVLLPREFMETYFFNVGDTLNITVEGYDVSAALALKIVGSFDYFPTWYPDTGPLVVGNLDYFFMQSQGQLPYRVWLDTQPDVDYDHLADEMWEMNLGAEAMLSAPQRILKAQRQPERQGLFGLLSVGFGAAAVLTALGFILYTLFSFRRRAVELGVLRAVGLSTRAMTAFIAWELIFLLVIGSAAGTGLGIWASHTFIPYLQMGADATAYTPPFIVEISWPAILRLYALFAALFVVALGVLVRSLMKMKLFQAIKMGETV